MILSYGLSLAGRSHLKKGIVCQDSHVIRPLQSGWYFAAVADGVGSASLSDQGSALAVKASLEYVEQHFHEYYQENAVNMPENAGNESEIDLCSLMKKAFEQALSELSVLAALQGNALEAYDTTLTAVFYDGAHVVYGQSGDGGIIGINKLGEYHTLSEVQKGEEYNQVYPLRTGTDKWVFNAVEEEYCALLLMTDGIYDVSKPSLLSSKAQQLYIPFIRQFMDLGVMDLCADNIDAFINKTEEYLYSDACKAINDDMTLAALLNTESPPPERESEFYKEPDWAALRAERFEKLYPANKKDNKITTVDI